MHLCRALGLYILNGRIKGDSLGRFTCCSSLGSSVVDYAISDMDPSSFNAFAVRQQTPLSDHNQINVFLKMDVRSRDTNMKSSELYKLNSTYRWTPNSLEKFTQALNSPELAKQITNFTNKPFTTSRMDINMAVNELNMLFHRSAQKAELIRKNKKKSKKQAHDWFDSECQGIRKHLRQLSNLKHQQPENTTLRIEHCETLKTFKHTIKRKKINHTNQILHQIEESIDNNQFWEMWNNLSTTKSQESVLPIQNGTTWTEHFKNLYDKIPLNQKQNLIKEKLLNLESVIKDNQNPLDYPISAEELAQKLKTLKPKKGMRHRQHLRC